MSFAAPLVLLALLALPLLALAYLRMERDRAAGAAAFAQPRVQPSVAPRRPRWRRHLPLLAFALAIAALTVAAAKPQRTVAVPVERASIVLATDVSGSMTATDVPPSRLDAAKAAGNKFVSSVPKRVNVGVLAFNTTPRILQGPTRDRQAVRDAIERMTPSGGTATGDAIDSAVSVLRAVPGEGNKRPPSAIVLLSDGASTKGRDPVAAAQAARKLKIPIYTVALGTSSGTITSRNHDGSTSIEPVPPDPRSLAEIARASGGKTFTAETASGLKTVYKKLGSQLGHKNQKRQVTSAFAGGGLLLLLGGVVMSLRWFGRII
jgi:Ca-activated chloride channel family protein